MTEGLATVRVRSKTHRAGRGQAGPCPTDEAHRPLPACCSQRAATLKPEQMRQRLMRQFYPVASFKNLRSFRGQRSTLVALLPFMRTDPGPDYRQLICQDGRQHLGAGPARPTYGRSQGRPPRCLDQRAGVQDFAQSKQAHACLPPLLPRSR
jgi:hypothetical protein